MKKILFLPIFVVLITVLSFSTHDAHATPTLTLTPNHGPIGTQFALSGSGYPVNTILFATFGDLVRGGVIDGLSFTTNASGNIPPNTVLTVKPTEQTVGTATAPVTPGKNYEVRIDTSTSVLARAPFTVATNLIIPKIQCMLPPVATFCLAAPNSLTIPAGTSSTINLVITRAMGFTANIYLSATSPPGIQVQNLGTATSSGGTVVPLISVGSSVPGGSYNVIVTGQSGLLSRSATITVTVPPHIIAIHPPLIPSWIKNTAKFWSQGQVSDDEFVKSIQYLINNKLITISQTTSNAVVTSGKTEGQIPPWVKNDANLWSQGEIDDQTFVQAIQYLVSQGMIRAGPSSGTEAWQILHVSPPPHPIVPQQAGMKIINPCLITPQHCLITSWNSNGFGLQFKSTTGIALDSSNNVYIPNTGHNVVEEFDSNGKYLNYWGGAGNTLNLPNPTGVAVDPSGNVWVITGGNSVVNFSNKGLYGEGGLDNTPCCFSLGTKFNNPTSITVDSSGNVYVADASQNQIQKFYPGGALLATSSLPSWTNFNVQVATPTAIALSFDPSGAMWAIINNQIAVTPFFPINPPPKSPDGGYDCTPACYQPSVCVYATCIPMGIGPGNGFGVKNPFIPPGSQFKPLCPPILNSKLICPPSYIYSGIAVDQSNNVFVTDSAKDRVLVFDKVGNYITSWGSSGSGAGQFNDPTGIAVDSSGNVYVVDTGNNRIEKFSSPLIS